ncbi:right-handed parallel beta-helix repeat-containing protein [Sabulilitoribacter multivorans]|uniref:Right-handed parallel beta-helix repeat-containing protein n=1 Tax=Flaviramulus multivorans TaxID=1304750 RepID=A0ABS9IJK6_9FLAO|nr:right-handed parallel beta-helix repeat-containing protein [Flaviramulus multivorans]MCF7560788.1 right-handed parallel beta-helix repeat-containing protein [Flaviramulus multivorans]
MKMNFKTTMLLFMFMISFLSCNQEELFVEPIAEEEVIDDTDEDNDETNDGDGEPDTGGDNQTDPTLPCDFNLNNVQANSTIVINCVLDLEGQTITLPSSVTIEYEGGDIINGTINFSDNGVIDGNLLNSTLTIGGSSPQVKDTAFNFIPERWGIVQGVTTSDIAWSNNKILESTMALVKELGVTTFKIDKIDAYFEGSRPTPPETNFYPHREAVNIPSDFNLVMTDNTHLRIQPATSQTEQLDNGAILSINDASNITVTGGTLHGDRQTRYFSPNDDGLEGSHLFYIQSGVNVTLDGIKFVNGSKGGLSISSIGFTYQPIYKPTNNIKVLNCEFTNIRRMSVALTDGRNLLFEGNTFTDTAQPDANADGGEVGYAMNIEAGRVRDANGVLVEREKVTDVIIRGNTETGSRGGSISVHIGQNVTIEDNDFETQVSYTYTNGTKIINNRFSKGSSDSSYAIFATGSGETVYNNEIGGNIIDGYTTGIILNSNDIDVHDNLITGVATGVLLTKTINSRVYNNDITASYSGISVGNTWLDNVEIKGNEISAGSLGMSFTHSNNKPEHANYTFTVTENIFKTDKKVSFSNVNGITFSKNEVAGIQIGNCSNLTISENTIAPTDFDGIRLYEGHTNISLLNNTIYEPTGADRYVCINNSSTNPSEINDTGNTCN